MNHTMSTEPLGDCLELELMTLCARLTIDHACEARIHAIIRQQVDWDYLIRTAHRHRVLPLLCRTLQRVAPLGVPEQAMRQLHGAYHANARRNLLLTGELLQVMNVFRSHDISCIPYKGPVLAYRLYGDVSLRQAGDLDVIVSVDNVSKARALLLSRGYRSERQKSEERLAWRTDKDITLSRDDDGIEFEIHWAVTSDMHPIQIPPQLLWKNLTTCSVGGQSVLTHRYEDLLPLLCFHGAAHGWERLAWLCDIADLMRSQPHLDWTWIIENADALGGRRILIHGLALAADLLGAEPPHKVIQMIRADPALIPLAEQARAWLSSEAPVSPGQRQEYFLRLREHPVDKLRVAFKQTKSYLAPTSRDIASFPVPRFLAWVLYPLRLVRLGREYGLAPFRRFFKGIFQS